MPSRSLLRVSLVCCFAAGASRFFDVFRLVTLPARFSHDNDSLEPHLTVENVHVVAPNADTNRTVLVQRQARGHLRNDWAKNPVKSPFAKLLLQHQSDCSIQTVQTFHLDNSFGIGSHVALWSQALCNAMQDGARLRTYNPKWLWLDQTLCDSVQARKSPWLCYFPSAEFQCGLDEEPPLLTSNVSDPRDLKRNQCDLLKQNPQQLEAFRAASTELLFRNVSPVVIREAQRQAGLIFPKGVAPPNLITVHMRWGDKFWEMDLVNSTEYIHAVRQLLREDNVRGPNDEVNIFLATEDPRALEEFRLEVSTLHPNWKVFYDVTVEELNDFRPSKGNRASHMTKNSNGRGGLVAMGSLLLAMEANSFVLTTKSNWSRIMDHLRRNILDVKCNNCTRMVDLRPGIW